MQRLRLKYGRGEKLKFLSHLDLMRLWERALRRAGLMPAYSEGFSPHPKISMAAPLPVGVTGRAEIMDIFLCNNISPELFVKEIAGQLPNGIEIIDTLPVDLQSPSLQSRLCFAEYSVGINTDRDNQQVESALSSMLAREQIPWHHTRDTGERHYNLRVLIDDLWLAGRSGNCCNIGMRLRCGSLGSGRPEQIIRALNLAEIPVSVERTGLIFA